MGINVIPTANLYLGIRAGRRGMMPNEGQEERLEEVIIGFGIPIMIWHESAGRRYR